jgi:hypothetical protein
VLHITETEAATQAHDRFYRTVGQKFLDKDIDGIKRIGPVRFDLVFSECGLDNVGRSSGET